MGNGNSFSSVVVVVIAVVVDLSPCHAVHYQPEIVAFNSSVLVLFMVVVVFRTAIHIMKRIKGYENGLFNDLRNCTFHQLLARVNYPLKSEVGFKFIVC